MMGKLFNAFAVVLLAAGCTANQGTAEAPRSNEREAVATYDREELGEVQRTEQGRVVSLTPVDIDDPDIETGTVVGAVAGGLAGRQLGGGSGRDIMTVIGAAAGGYAGSRMDDNTEQAEAVEIGLEMDDGDEIAVVQELDEDDRFRVGEYVTVVFQGERARVEH